MLESVSSTWGVRGGLCCGQGATAGQGQGRWGSYQGSEQGSEEGEAPDAAVGKHTLHCTLGGRWVCGRSDADKVVMPPQLLHACMHVQAPCPHERAAATLACACRSHACMHMLILCAQAFVPHYSRCASVGEILVVWNKGSPPDVSQLQTQVRAGGQGRTATEAGAMHCVHRVGTVLEPGRRLPR